MRKKQADTHSKKRVFSLPLYVYLGYLAVCTLLFTGGSFSGYLSSADGSDAARVAAGGITVNYTGNTTIELNQPTDPDNQTETAEFSFSVSNSASEVAICYDLVLTLDEQLPNGVTMTLDGKLCSGNSNNTYTFFDVGEFEAGKTQTNTHTLTFSGDYLTIQEQSERKITISVRAEQID